MSINQLTIKLNKVMKLIKTMKLTEVMKPAEAIIYETRCELSVS